MVDKTKLISNLAKAHDLFGKGKDVYSRLAYVKEISELDPKDGDALKKFVGLADKDSKKLRKMLDARLKSVNEAVKAPFDPVDNPVEAKRDAVLKAFYKYGPEAKQSAKALEDCAKAMDAYDLKLRERISYCQILSKHALRQKKVHIAIQKHMITTEKVLTTLAKLPRYDTGTTAMYLFTREKYSFVKYRAEQIAKAYDKLSKSALAHEKEVEAERKANAAWLKEVRKKQLQDLIRKGKEFLGMAA